MVELKAACATSIAELEYKAKVVSTLFPRYYRVIGERIVSNAPSSARRASTLARRTSPVLSTSRQVAPRRRRERWAPNAHFAHSRSTSAAPRSLKNTFAAVPKSLPHAMAPAPNLSNGKSLRMLKLTTMKGTGSGLRPTNATFSSGFWTCAPMIKAQAPVLAYGPCGFSGLQGLSG